MIDEVPRHERVTKPCRDHAKHPIIAIAAINGLPADAKIVQNLLAQNAELAIDAFEVRFVLEVDDLYSLPLSQPVRWTDGDHHLFAKQGQIMKSFVSRLFRSAIDRHLEVAHQQLAVQLAGTGVDDPDLDVGMGNAHLRYEVDKLVRCDRTHNPQPKLDAAHAQKLTRTLGRPLRLLVNLIQVGPHDAAELGEVCVGPLAVE